MRPQALQPAGELLGPEGCIYCDRAPHQRVSLPGSVGLSPNPRTNSEDLPIPADRDTAPQPDCDKSPEALDSTAIARWAMGSGLARECGGNRLLSPERVRIPRSRFSPKSLVTSPIRVFAPFTLHGWEETWWKLLTSGFSDAALLPRAPEAAVILHAEEVGGSSPLAPSRKGAGRVGVVGLSRADGGFVSSRVR